VFDCPGLSHSVIGFAEAGFTVKRSGGGTEGSGFFVRWVELEVCLEVGWNELVGKMNKNKMLVVTGGGSILSG
jgi:hypothetical protein